MNPHSDPEVKLRLEQEIGLPLEKKCFFKRLRKLVEEPDCFTKSWLYLVPDYYHIDQEKRIITCVEIENRRHFTGEQLNSYIKLWYYLDCEGFQTQLFISGHRGNVASTINLEDEYTFNYLGDYFKYPPQD